MGTDNRTTGAFLFTDIEGSTRRWERFGELMDDAVAQHDALINAAVDAQSGRVFHTSGDGVIAWFDGPTHAVAAAIGAQQQLTEHEFPNVDGLRVRMAVHVGDVVVRDGEPYGWALNFGSRLNDLGHGGQILISEPAVAAIGGTPPESSTIVDLGRHHLRDIAEPTGVGQVVVPSLTTEFPPLRNAAHQDTPSAGSDRLIGRDDDIAAVDRRLAPSSVLTIVGLPGIGATEVASAAANRAASRFAYGRIDCDLERIAPPRMLDAIGSALSLGPRPGQSLEDALVEWLSEHAVLLVLDHVDHGTETVARFGRRLVAAGGGSALICTSHRPLGIDAERVHRLAPLDLADAIALFRTRSANAGTPSTDTDELIGELCERLDRVPLRIEVAASNAAAFSTRELLDMLDRDELTTEGEPTIDAIDVAVTGLDEQARRCLAAATTFAAGFDRQAFAEVCAPELPAADASRVLAELVNRSLVHADRSADTAWFRVLSSVGSAARRHATDDQLAAADDRFASSIERFVDTAADGLRGADERLWDRRLERSFGNVRAALGRAVAGGDLRRAAHLSTALWEYGFMRMREEYFRWSELVLDTFASAHERHLGAVHGVAALGAWTRGELGATQEWAERALRLEREYELDFDLPARLALINAAVYSGARQPPLEIYAEEAEYERSQAEPYFHVNVDTRNSIMATWFGDLRAAERRALRAVQLARESGNASSLSFALWALGTALDETDPMRAESLLGQGLETARDVHNDWVTALVQMSLASLRRRTAGPLAAIPLLLDLLDLLWRAGHRSHLWATLRVCVLVLDDIDEAGLATTIDAAADDASMAMPPLPVDAAALEERRARAAAMADYPAQHVLGSTTPLPALMTATREALSAALENAPASSTADTHSL
ncbi:MAG: hypothetical protein AAGA42_02825 [Actinomycetota bacterium]